MTSALIGIADLSLSLHMPLWRSTTQTFGFTHESWCETSTTQPEQEEGQ